MKTINYIATVIALMASTYIQGAGADTVKTFPSLEKIEIQRARMQWENTLNAAGMKFGDMDRGSFTTLGVYTGSGDYHRVQEGSENKGILFQTQRYDRLNDKILVKGTFTFNMDKEFDKGWSDVYNPYNGNPFIYGSSVRGTYETQLFDLGLRVYSKYKSRFNYGLAIDYKVADIARQRDPRSRSYHLNYSLVPSVVYEINGKQTIGANLSYRFGKEKMPGLTTIQTDPNLKYYTFSGLEHVDGTIGGYKGFSRQFLSDYCGGAIQYNYRGEKSRVLISAGFDAKWEETLGSVRQSPGSYNEFTYSFLADYISEKGNLMQNIRAEATIKDGGADEFRQELNSELDTLTGITTETWETIYVYKNRFVVKTSDYRLSWSLTSTDPDKRGYRWSVGAEAGYEGFSNNYYLPSSEYSSGKILIGLNGKVRLLDSHKGRLVLSASSVASLNTSAKLDLATESIVGDEILKPDFEYHKMNTIRINGELRYTFRLRMVKSTPILGYASLYGGNTSAQGGKGWYTAGVSIGILTL